MEAVEDIRSKFCKSLKNENWIWFTEREAFDIGIIIHNFSPLLSIYLYFKQSFC